MRKFRVSVNGHNFLIDLGNGLARYGFYVTCYVEAGDMKEAELKAVHSVRQRREIKRLLGNKNDSSPMLTVEETEETEPFECTGTETEQGFIWYPE